MSGRRDGGASRARSFAAVYSARRVPPDDRTPDVLAEADGTAPRVSLTPVVWSVLLGVGVLALIGYVTFDPVAFVAAVRGASVWGLVAALATVVVRVWFGGLRLRHFSGGQIGAADSVRDQIVWDFFAYVTPSTVGGGPFLAVFMAREGQLPAGEATSVVLFAMLVDQITFALTIPILLALAPVLDVFPQALGTAGSWALGLFFAGYMVWVLLLGYGTLVRPDRLARGVRWLFSLRWLSRFAGRAEAATAGMEERARSLRSQSVGFYLKGFGLSAVPWICRYLLAVFVIGSVFPAADGLLVFLRSAALQLGATAVITPGGSGGVEGLYVLFLGPTMPAALVAPTLLVWRVLSFYAFLAAGAVIVARSLRAGTRRLTAERAP